MTELPQFSRDVLKALVGGPIAWRSPAEVAEALGRAVDETTETLACLDASGWVEVWERDEGLVVTLSVLGAARLGVRLVEVGPDEVPRWASLGDPEPPAPRARGVAREARVADLLSVVDPGFGPSLAAEAAERAEAAAGGAAGGVELPRPTRLVGQGLTPWPGPAERDPATSTCPACKDRPLLPHLYCLCCDRWGLDHRLTPSVNRRRTSRQARPASPPNEPRRDPAHLHPDRARRKARHAARMAARLEADRRRRSREARS